MLSSFFDRWLPWLVAGTILTYYFILCVVLATERICHVDTAYYLFHVIQGNIEFIAPRPAAILTLWAAQIGVWIGLPLHALMVGYSISFALTYGLIGIVTYRLVPRHTTWIMLALAPLISTANSFFNPANEASLALMLCASLLCIWRANRISSEPKLSVAAMVMVCLALLAHPSSIFMIGFILLITEAEFKFKNFPWRTLGLICLACAFSVVSVVQMEIDTPSQMGGFGEMLNPRHFNFTLSNPALNYLYLHSGIHSTIYVPCAAIWLGGLILLAFQHRWAMLSVSLAAIPTLILLIGSQYFTGESAVVLEKSLLPLSLFALTGLTISVSHLDGKWPMRITMIVCLAFALIRFNDILHRGAWETKRLQTYTQIWDQSGASKVIVNANSEFGTRLIIPWCTGVESLLYSSSQSGTRSSKTIFVATNEVPNRLTSQPDLFVAADFSVPIESAELNAHYFQLDSVPYTFLP